MHHFFAIHYHFCVFFNGLVRGRRDPIYRAPRGGEAEHALVWKCIQYLCRLTPPLHPAWDAIMNINEIMKPSENMQKADKSAVGTINRPLRMSGVLC
jgi:hypothetical protein